MASAVGAIAILNEIASLEPVAFDLVAKLVHGLQGQTDAQILAADSTTLASIITTAHQEAVAAQ